MSNDISTIKNVLDKQYHKVSVSHDIPLNQKQNYIGITKNQEKVLIIKAIILKFKIIKKENFPESNSSSKKESEMEEKIPMKTF